jgi:hypothetical protein
MSKQRVENCLTIAPPRGALLDTKGIWHWSRHQVSVEYSIHVAYSELRVSMNQHTQEIPLCSTTPNYGGTRWWFQCPKCERRVSRLHKPVNEHCFFCRDCHNLTYESAQLSGTDAGRVLLTIAARLDITRYEARQWVALNPQEEPFALHEVMTPVVNGIRDRRTGPALLLTKEARKRGLSL